MVLDLQPGNSDTQTSESMPTTTNAFSSFNASVHRVTHFSRSTSAFILSCSTSTYNNTLLRTSFFSRQTPCHGRCGRLCDLMELGLVQQVPVSSLIEHRCNSVVYQSWHTRHIVLLMGDACTVVIVRALLMEDGALLL